MATSVVPCQALTLPSGYFGKSFSYCAPGHDFCPEAGGNQHIRLACQWPSSMLNKQQVSSFSPQAVGIFLVCTVALRTGVRRVANKS